MAMQNQRKIYGETLVKLGGECGDIAVLEADLGKSTMSILFQNAYPERFFEMGIGEQNMAAFAAGLALSGKIPFINSFAVFTTGRCYDQIRQSICTARLNVKIGGSSAGLSDFGDGATHQSVEDIAIMRALPNMTVIVPADGFETEQAVRFAAKTDGPVYLRISRSDTPDVTDKNQAFDLKPSILREGQDIVLFACGIMVTRALGAADQLAGEGVSARVVNVKCLKPFDDEAVAALARGFKGVVTCEEHSIIGGLGSAVAMALRNEAVPMECVAINDMFGQSAHSADELMDFYGLNPGAIVQKAKSIMKNSR